MKSSKKRVASSSNEPKQRIECGSRFGKWTARHPVKTGRGSTWLMNCDCGIEKEVRTAELLRGRSKSCGCNSGFAGNKKNITHGRSRDPEYIAWNNLKGRDIEVDSRWLIFENFDADMGRRPPGLFLVHVNPELPIGPGNAEWGLPRQKNWKRVEPLLADAIEAEYGITPVIEYRFTEKRKWRLDVAIPELKFGIELDGHRYHSSAAAQRNDAEKNNFLMCSGWTLFRYPAGTIFNHKRRRRIVEQVGRFLHKVLDLDADACVLTGD